MAKCILVQTGQLAAVSPAPADRDFGGTIGTALGIGNDRRTSAGIAGNRKTAGGIRTTERCAANILDQSANIAGQIDRDQGQYAFDLDLTDQCLAVWSPCDIVDRAVIIDRQICCAAAVGSHQIDIILLVGSELVVISEIGDTRAIGGNFWREIGAVALGQRGDSLAGQFHAVYFAFDRIEISVFGFVAGDQQRAVAQPLRAIKAIFSLGHLPRRAALGAEDEYLGLALGQIAGTVKPEHEIIDNPDRLCPFGPLRAFWRLGKAWTLIGYQHGESDALAIRGPDRRARTLFQLRE